MEKINVFSGNEVISRILIGSSIGDLAYCLEPYRHVYTVFDKNVLLKSRSIMQLSESVLKSGAPMLAIDVSEENKSMDTVLEICSWLLRSGADRDALVLAVGGGITTDMVGFAASIYKRGVRFAYVPTTLLAQVDAAIGGKTGVNFHDLKNMLGEIHQPEFTFLCPQVLETLPQRDFLSGASEMLKTFIIEDGGNYRQAVAFLKRYAASPHDHRHFFRENYAGLMVLVTEAARVKAGVVSRDQFEGGERRKLNLGHTFAHAIESLSRKDGRDITHGEAVAMGMVMAARLAETLAQTGEFEAEKGLAERLESDLRQCGLPVDSPYGPEEMVEAMKIDKKAENGKVHFVLPKAVGEVVIADLDVERVVNLLKDY